MSKQIQKIKDEFKREYVYKNGTYRHEPDVLWNFIEQSIKQTEQEMIDKIEDKLNKISYTEELLGGMYDPGGMGAEVVNLDEVIEYLESLKHDK